MSRLSLTFECQGLQLAGTLDTAPGKTGLLMVSGGNEIRAGAFSGQSRLAAKLAEAGHPVFRFDRRGIGDSDGENRGFRRSGKDIRAARDAFAAISPQLDTIIAFGNCDAASALMLTGGEGFGGLILANPWTFDDDNETAMPSAAIRSRYLSKLKDVGEIRRLLTGGVSIRKLFSGLKRASKPQSETTKLAQEMAAGLQKFDGPYHILLAEKDRTAQAFDENWHGDGDNIRRLPDASHAFVEPQSFVWLEEQITEFIKA